MTGMDLSGLGEFGKNLEALLRRIPKEKLAFLRSVGEAAKASEDASIKGSGFSDGGDKLAGWQRYYIGSKGGYVAVRPIGKRDHAPAGDNSPGAITRYNELGHAIRRRTKTTGRYRPLITMAQVPGRRFYEGAESAIVAEADRLLDDYAKRMEQELEGLT